MSLIFVFVIILVGTTFVEMIFLLSSLPSFPVYAKLQSKPLLLLFSQFHPSSPSSLSSSRIIATHHGISIDSNTNKTRIGFVKPIFTEAAYNNKFYIFYSRYARIPYGVNMTKDLSLLNSKILFSNLQSLSNKTQLYALSDLDIDNGAIFYNANTNKSMNLYDILVLGHQEYVTQKEYDNLKQFVFNGGTMILLDGNVFYAEVRYNDNNNTISLVKGHGWAYNGKTAWRSIDERWKNETSQWVGSNYLCYLCVKSFKNDPFGYLPHEEQYITNPNDKIIFNFNPVESPNALSSLKSKVSIAAYSLDYGKGKVISFGIYSDDVIHNSNFIKFFDSIVMNTLLHRS